MKILPLLVCSLLISMVAQGSDRMVDVKQLPSPVTSFVAQNFPKQKIAMAYLDNELFGQTTYKLRLDNGTKIEITPKGKWLEMDGRQHPIPDSLVPAKVLSAVKTMAGGSYIKEIERKRYGYKVELASGTELKFDPNGTLLHVDD